MHPKKVMDNRVELYGLNLESSHDADYVKMVYFATVLSKPLNLYVSTDTARILPVIEDLCIRSGRGTHSLINGGPVPTELLLRGAEEQPYPKQQFMLETLQVGVALELVLRGPFKAADRRLIVAGGEIVLQAALES